MRSLGNGKWEEMSPRLGRAGAELTDLGIPAKEALRVVARVRRNADSAARTFVHLFVEEVWKPFQREGSPDEQWPDIRDALERLRPLASDSMLALLQMAMEDEVEEAFGRELKRARARSPPSEIGAAILSCEPCGRRGFSLSGRSPARSRGAMARGDVRIAATLECQECKRRNYQTQKSKRNNPDRIELRKYCRWCGHHTPAQGNALAAYPSHGPEPPEGQGAPGAPQGAAVRPCRAQRCVRARAPARRRADRRRRGRRARARVDHGPGRGPAPAHGSERLRAALAEATRSPTRVHRRSMTTPSTSTPPRTTPRTRPSPGPRGRRERQADGGLASRTVPAVGRSPSCAVSSGPTARRSPRSRASCSASSSSPARYLGLLDAVFQRLVDAII